MVDSISLVIPERSLAITALFFLILVVVGGALISPHNKLSGRGRAALPMKSLGRSPILQIELARTGSDLVDVLATGDLARNLRDADVGNKLDTYLFIPAYAGLLISIGLLLAGEAQNWSKGLILLAVLAVPVAAICDWTENAGIRACLDHFKQDGGPQPADAVRISRPSLVKWTILAIILLIYGLTAFGKLAARRSALSGMALIAVVGTFLGCYLVLTLFRYLSELNNTSRAFPGAISAVKVKNPMHLYKDSEEGKSVPFKDVFSEELKVLAEKRQQRQVPQRSRPLANDLVGLAFSGGGIRSATFNLGVLQALAKNNLLSLIDYLSTVSGGGYIGSWLSSWAYYLAKQNPAAPNQIAQIEAQLNHVPREIDDVAEPRQIHMLRRYSNYLTPRLGALSGDTLAFVGTYVRNLVLNQIILISAILALLIVPRAIGLILFQFSGSASAVVCAVLSLLLLVWVCVEVLRNTKLTRGGSPAYVVIRIAIPLFLFCVSITYAIWQFATLWPKFADVMLSPLLMTRLGVVGLVALIYALGWLFAGFSMPNGHVEAQSTKEGRAEVISRDLRWLPGAWGFPSGCVAGAFLLIISHILSLWPVTDARSIWYVLTFGVPLTMLSVLLVGALHLGLIGRAYEDSLREWWARMGGIECAVMIVWCAVCLLTLFLPLGMERLWARLLNPDHTWATRIWKMSSAIGVTGAVSAWVGITIKGLFAAKSSRTGVRPQSGDRTEPCAPQNKSDDRLARLAPPVFAVGLMFALSILLYFVLSIFGIHSLAPASFQLAKWNSEGVPPEVQLLHHQYDARVAKTVGWSSLALPSDSVLASARISSCSTEDRKSSAPCLQSVSAYHWLVLSYASWWKVLVFGLCLIALSYSLGWRVDVNEFSLHNAYRNRLVRCYLGATNSTRRPNPFTGFDEKDNIFLHLLVDLGAPFHLLNATLNVVKGKELALQARKARSFVFTPLYSGFDYAEDETVGEMPGAMKTVAADHPTSDEKVTKKGGYRLTRHCSWKSRYPGARLGTAMAISGAAVSPSMGHYTTGAVSFLLTVFSVRLGWWLGNPRSKECWENGWPKSSWRALMNELTGSTNEDQCEVYLSDGGHFENLGVYELIRRRCRCVIACDAGADPSCLCNDLAALVEKCRVDFATKIEIKIEAFRPTQPLLPGDEKVLRVSKTPFEIGTIFYPDDSKGVLIYIKPSLLNVPELQDVIAYARMAESFPHQSTVDQFFDESQFESYRALGFACASAAIGQINTAIRA